MVPYSTWVSAASLVVQATVALENETPEAAMEDRTGAVVSGAAVVAVAVLVYAESPPVFLASTR